MAYRLNRPVIYNSVEICAADQIMRPVESLAAVLAVLVTLVTATATIETRYAKSADVRQELNGLYAKTLKLRILEIQLKPPPLEPSDKALLEHLQQELREATAQ